MRRTRKAYLLTNPSQAYTSMHTLQELLAAMRGLFWLQWTAHWQVSGPSFGADHEMFSGFYYRTQNEIDTLAEKIVGMFGPESVCVFDQTNRMHEKLQMFKEIDDLFLRVLSAEHDLQILINTVLKILKDFQTMTPGMEDFLQTMANEHEANIYKLQQRIRDVDGLPGIHKEPMDFKLVGNLNQSKTAKTANSTKTVSTKRARLTNRGEK